MPKFPHHPYESAAPNSDDHNFLVRTLICSFFDSTESSLSLEFNKMKFSANHGLISKLGHGHLRNIPFWFPELLFFGTEMNLICSRLRMA